MDHSALEIAALRQELDMFKGLCLELAQQNDAMQTELSRRSFDCLMLTADVSALTKRLDVEEQLALKNAQQTISSLSDVFERVRELEAHCFPRAAGDLLALSRIVGTEPNRNTFDLDNRDRHPPA